MNRLAVCCAVSLLALLCSAGLSAQQNDADSAPPSREEKVTIDILATVTGINPETREITLEDAQGNVRVTTAGPRVKRFDELKVGDRVSANIEITTLAELREPTAEELANTGSVKRGVVSGEGEGPLGGSIAEAATAVVTVVGLNLLTETITVQTEDGRLADVRAKSQDNLKKLRLGDRIVITYYASLVVSVESIATGATE